MFWPAEPCNPDPNDPIIMDSGQVSMNNVGANCPPCSSPIPIWLQDIAYEEQLSPLGQVRICQDNVCKTCAQAGTVMAVIPLNNIELTCTGCTGPGQIASLTFILEHWRKVCTVDADPACPACNLFTEHRGFRLRDITVSVKPCVLG